MTNHGEKLQALVVEDDPLIADLTVYMLEELGYEVLATVRSVAEGLAFLAEHTPGVAILDVNLGKESSAELAGLFAGRRVPFIYTTGYDRVPDLMEKYPAPVVRKPFGVDELDAALKKATCPG